MAGGKAPELLSREAPGYMGTPCGKVSPYIPVKEEGN
jgi:hypothetical protein